MLITAFIWVNTRSDNNDFVLNTSPAVPFELPKVLADIARITSSQVGLWIGSQGDTFTQKAAVINSNSHLPKAVHLILSHLERYYVCQL
jgi:hypothetical protein